MKKFELTANSKMHSGKKLFQIRALISFGNVKEGALGGFIEKEDNLSQSGDAWVSGNARVFGNAWVSGNARVSDNAWVSGNARVSNNARVFGNAWVSGNARVSDNAWVSGSARVSDNAWVSGNARVSGEEDIAYIRGFGSEYRPTTFFKCDDGETRTQCGCFNGTLGEFRKKVKETHGDSKYAKEYLMIADLMELHFRKEN